MFTSLSFGFRLGLEEGDSVREVDRLTVDADLEGVVAVAEVAIFWRACSSAMRESMAPLSRYGQDKSAIYSRGCHAPQMVNVLPGTLCPHLPEAYVVIKNCNHPINSRMP